MNWLTEFAPFTFFHILTVTICAAVCWAIIWAGRRATQADPDGDRTIRLWLGWGALAWQLVINIWWACCSGQSIEQGLPLHVCDVAAMAVGPALIWRPRILITLVYFWGLGLSTQGFLTPVLEQGIAHPAFWSFWVGHTLIVGGAIYFVVAQRYAPTLPDLARIIALGFPYLLAIAVFNHLVGTNYAYIGDTTPDAPTILDRLGPYPQRAFLVTAMAHLILVAVYLPWPIARAIRNRRPTTL